LAPASSRPLRSFSLLGSPQLVPILGSQSRGCGRGLWFVFVSVSVVPAQIKRGQHGLPLLQRCRHFSSSGCSLAVSTSSINYSTSDTLFGTPPFDSRNISKKETKHQRRSPIDSEKYPGDTPLPFLPHHHCPVLSTISVIVSPLTIDLSSRYCPYPLIP
jgi:hypothetical protein